MKRTTSTIIFAALMLAALVSCKKEDDSTSTTSTATTSTTSGSTNNPLLTKACRGQGTIEVNSVKDTLTAMEAVLPPLNLYGIYCDATWGSLTMQSGDKKLPAGTKTFTISGDPSKMPGANEMAIEYYDENTEKDYYATGGTVSYTVSSSEKMVKFANITFKDETGAVKTISYEVKLK